MSDNEFDFEDINFVEENDTYNGSDDDSERGSDFEEEDRDIIEEDQEEEEDLILEENSKDYTSQKVANTKITNPAMTNYEASVILKLRAMQIDKGYLSKLDKEVLEKGITNSLEIARYEFLNKALRYTVRRKLPNGKVELWREKDFLFFPEVGDVRFLT